METKNRQKTLIIVAVSIVGLLVLNSILFQPLWGAWKSNNEKIAKLKAEVNLDQALLNNKAKHLDQWKRIQDNALPGNPSLAVSDMLGAKERWSQASRIVPTTFQPQIKNEDDPQSRETITTMECRVDAEGTMQSLLLFLAAIENDPMGVRLEDVQFTSKDNYGRDLTLGLGMSALILGMPQTSNP